MKNETAQSYTAFDGNKLIAEGALDKVVLLVRQRLKTNSAASVLVFSDLTGKQMDFDLRGTEKEVLQKLQVYRSTTDTQASTPSGPGRPKLGVVAREVSLLPRHWEWLSTQSGGASATLRRLVDEAKKTSSGKELIKEAQERTHKFMSALAGDLPNYEEALRDLYKKDQARFKSQIADWPADIREYTRRLSAAVFE